MNVFVPHPLISGSTSEKLVFALTLRTLAVSDKPSVQEGAELVKTKLASRVATGVPESDT